MDLVPEDLGLLTGILAEAARVPLAFVLEGGYGPSHGLAFSAIVNALEGESYATPAAPAPRESTGYLAGFLKNVVTQIKKA
jgi:acetoin utilization deacetylase AcuC-like enzyme